MCPEASEVLVVDLDGTLLSSDISLESFWSSLGRDWQNPFQSLASARERDAQDQHSTLAPAVNIATLPYNPDVIAYIEKWRRAGGRSVLVTASNKSFAEAIAAHLGIFDETHGSDGQLDLKGMAKAEFLEHRFGRHGFTYMGHSSADLPVWERAGAAITVNAPAALRQQAEQASQAAEHIGSAHRSLAPYIETLRPHQWLKNVLIFLPMLAAHQLDGATILQSFLGFVCFCLVASSVYALNDLLDLAADRAHPRKKLRPLASGRLPITHGSVLAFALLVPGILLAKVIGDGFVLIMLAYYLLTVAYSLCLKRRIVIDICILAALYTTRILAGGVATGIPLSVWMLAFAVFFFLSMAAVKRQAELVDAAARGSLVATGRSYTTGDLPIIGMIGISAGYVSVLVMTLYVNSPTVMVRYSLPEALWGVCAVLLYWITRTVMIAHRGRMHDDPIVFAIKDPVSLICLAAILGLVVTGTIE